MSADRLRATRLRVELLAAVDQACEEGRPPPCVVDPGPFTSEDRGDRAEAATACRTGCRLRALCGRYAVAVEPVAYVWGGVDVTPDRPGAKPRLHLLVEQVHELEQLGAARSTSAGGGRE